MTSYLKQTQLRFIIGLIGFYIPLVKAAPAVIAVPACYSSYHLEQKINLSVKLQTSFENKIIRIDSGVHIRGVKTPESILASLARDKSINVQSFVMLITPNISTVNGINANFGERYSHPFLFHINQNNGELVDYQSTQSEKSIIKEYLSYIDFFQYSQSSGSFIYRNANGKYSAEILTANSDNNPTRIEKRNKGYLDSNQKLRLKSSIANIKLSDNKANCFYDSARIEEAFRNSISKQSFVEGSAIAELINDYSKSLPVEHYFHSITGDLSTWPTVALANRISLEKALIQIPFLFSELQTQVDNKSEFLIVMKTNKVLWEHFAEYLSSNQSDVDLVNRIIWALDRIDSHQSVKALLKIAIIPTSEKYVNRAIQALASTSSSIDIESLELLKSQVESYRFSSNNSANSLLLVRALGLFAKRRDEYSSLQSKEIKQFLYSQLSGANEEFKSTLIESIGSLGETIDTQGVFLLIAALDDTSNKVSQSASRALRKLPFDSEFSDYYLSKIDSDINYKTKSNLIALLGSADASDRDVKNKLIEIIEKTNSNNHKYNALKSLKKIDYAYNDYEVKVLKSRLGNEADKENQKLLASLILKNQRKELARQTQNE